MKRDKMGAILSATTTLFLVLGVSCLVDPALIQSDEGSTHQDIINGQACADDEMESAVAILVEAEIDMFGVQLIKTVVCTGTLIAPDVVLAAAHCFDPSALTMGFGTVNWEKYYISFEHDLVSLAEGDATFPSDAIEAVDWIMHPEFDLNSMQEVNGPGDYKDIGLMFLSRQVNGVDFEILITESEASQITTNATVDIAGWGQQTQTSGPFDPPPPGTVGKKICAESFINDIGTAEFQIGGDASTSRKCHGDSGGPTYLDITTSGSRSRRLIGITSHAYDSTDCAKGGVDTRVDYWLDWINSTMEAGCSSGTRVWCTHTGIVPASWYDQDHDAGPPVDATFDATVTSPDAASGADATGTADATGSTADTGVGPADAGVGSKTDTDYPDLEEVDGCLCTTSANGEVGPPHVLLALLCGLLWWRRR